MATQDKNKWKIQDIQNYINQNNIPEEVVAKIAVKSPFGDKVSLTDALQNWTHKGHWNANEIIEAFDRHMQNNASSPTQQQPTPQQFQRQLRFQTNTPLKVGDTYGMYTRTGYGGETQQAADDYKLQRVLANDAKLQQINDMFAPKEWMKVSALPIGIGVGMGALPFNLAASGIGLGTGLGGDYLWNKYTGKSFGENMVDWLGLNNFSNQYWDPSMSAMAFDMAEPIGGFLGSDDIIKGVSKGIKGTLNAGKQAYNYMNTPYGLRIGNSAYRIDPNTMSVGVPMIERTPLNGIADQPTRPRLSIKSTTDADGTTTLVIGNPFTPKTSKEIYGAFYPQLEKMMQAAPNLFKEINGYVYMKDGYQYKPIESFPYLEERTILDNNFNDMKVQAFGSSLKGKPTSPIYDHKLKKGDVHISPLRDGELSAKVNKGNFWAYLLAKPATPGTSPHPIHPNYLDSPEENAVKMLYDRHFMSQLYDRGLMYNVAESLGQSFSPYSTAHILDQLTAALENNYQVQLDINPGRSITNSVGFQDKKDQMDYVDYLLKSFGIDYKPYLTDLGKKHGFDPQTYTPGDKYDFLAKIHALRDKAKDMDIKSKQYEDLAANATSEVERTDALENAELYRLNQDAIERTLKRTNTSLATPVEQQRILNDKLVKLDDLLGGELSKILGDISEYGYKPHPFLSMLEGPSLRFQVLRKNGGKLKRFS